MRPQFAGWLLGVGLLVNARAGIAGRPFVTDDAATVGRALLGVETWLQLDDVSLQHSLLTGVGPTDWLELTTGVTHGMSFGGDDQGYSVTGPLVQAKLLFRAATTNGLPGVALAVGVIPPIGHGAFVPPGWGTFGYGALTQSLFDDELLFHANVGGAFMFDGTQEAHTLTLGFAAQLHIVSGLQVFSEIFYGDPYAPDDSAWAVQGGALYAISAHLQVDATFARTLSGSELTQWGTAGLRIVSSELW